MPTLLNVQTDSDKVQFCSLAGPTPLTPDMVARQAPDASWLLTDAMPVARCSLWWRKVPAFLGQRLGLIGHYSANAGAAGVGLLQRACERLTDEGCTLAVGPMDGNTWNRYRLVTERGTEAPFFLEPDNPADWPEHFAAAGFTPLAHYYSALCDDLETRDPRTDAVAERLATEGVTLRHLDLARFDEELRRIHAVAVESFRDNFLYTPIDADSFLALYRGVREHLRPELVLLAEREGRVIGFVFALPDLLQAQRGQPIDTILVKTVAVHPEHTSGGLGGLLVSRCHEAARALGYRRAIHALMHQDNRSRRISAHTAHVIRRYTLYARPLGPQP